MEKNGIRCCNSCFSQTCLLKYDVAKSMGLSYNGPRNCKRSDKKALKFGHLKDLWTPSESSNGKTKIAQKQATMVIQPEPRPSAMDNKPPSLLDDLISFEAENSEEIDDRFMMISSNAFSAKAKPCFTTDTLPNFKAMLSNVMVMDKECPICSLNGLDTLQMFDHWEEDHGVTRESPVEMWNTALEEYDGSNSEPSTYSPDRSSRQLGMDMLIGRVIPATLQYHRPCPRLSRRIWVHSGRRLRPNSTV